MLAKNFFRIFLIASFFVLFFWGNTYTQVIYMDVTGTATDEQRNILPGVEIEITNVSTGFNRATTTDTDGKYLFKSLPSQGEYQIKAALKGFITEIKKGLTFSMNMTYTINFTLKISPIEETITVEAKAPLVDVKRATSQQTFSENLVKSLPLSPMAARSYIYLAQLSPAVSYDVWMTRGGPTGISGQHYWTMNFLVDGSSNFSKWRSSGRSWLVGGYSIEMIKEVQMLSHQFSAEFGEGMASIHSAITKSGTNDFRGSLTLFVHPGDWDSPDLLTKIKAPFDQQQFGFTLGGPIKKDKTHFFLAYEGRLQRAENIVIAPEYYGQTVPDNQDEHVGLIKIDHQLSNTSYLTGRFNFNTLDWRSEFGQKYYNWNLPGEGFTYILRIFTLNLAWIKNTSAASINELRFQFASYKDLRKQLTKYPDRAGEDRTGWSVIGGMDYYGDGFGTTPENTYELFEKYSWEKGKHFFKAGTFVKFVYTIQPFLPYPRGHYYFAGPPDKFPNPYMYIQGFALDPKVAELKSYNIAGGLFFEDEWSVTKKFTLTLGARYDVEQPFGLKHYNAPLDWNNFAPRLGFAYDIGGYGKSVLRGGIGLFYQQQLTYHYTKCDDFGPDGIVYLTLTPGSPYFPTYANYLPSFPPGAVLPPRDIWEVDDHFKNPYSLQVTIGYKREILPTLSFGVDFVLMNVYDGLSVIDDNAPTSTKPVPRTLAEANATRPIIPVPNGFRIIYHLGNLSRTWYRAMEVTLERRGSNFSFVLTYCLSKTTDMLNPWTLPEDSRDLEADKAVSNNDQRHKVRLSFFYKTDFKNILLRDWQLSGIFYYQSASPYTETYGDDRWGTGQRDARPNGRNNLWGDPLLGCDFALSRIFLVKNFQLELRAEVFNPFNIINYDIYFVYQLSAGVKFGQPTKAAPARQFQLALIFRF